MERRCVGETSPEPDLTRTSGAYRRRVTVVRDRADAARAWTSLATAFVRVLQREDINFLLTNRIPRRAATLAMGWLSRIESPQLTRLSLAAWQALGGDLR